MLEREFTETVDTVEEGGTIVSKVCVRFCVANGEAILKGIGGTKSRWGVQGKGGINDLVQRSVGLMAAGGNISWERIFGLEMTAAKRDGLCFLRRESAISILQILTTRLYYCRVLDSLRLKKDSSTGTKVCWSWREVCRQRSRRGFVVSQDKLTQPRESIAF